MEQTNALRSHHQRPTRRYGLTAPSSSPCCLRLTAVFVRLSASSCARSSSATPHEDSGYSAAVRPASQVPAKDVEYVGYDLDARYHRLRAAAFWRPRPFYCAVCPGPAAGAGCHRLRPGHGDRRLHHLETRTQSRCIAQAWSCLKPGGTVDARSDLRSGPIARAHFFAAHDRGDQYAHAHNMTRSCRTAFTDVRHTSFTDMYSVPYTILINRAKKTPGVEHPAPNRER